MPNTGPNVQTYQKIKKIAAQKMVFGIVQLESLDC